ncbi:6-hydroxy-D-nicotine oxidase [Madurella mycetomatis]|uniref:6-hydroxy-D-nicotine oxidase n=1 Tax=Madurella mycetomatis TaxID=100816 RepID=A0A175W3H8_9PEZI|nr:6-hydroxy-D-nicotine oxidase [Madurella mycetomatis]
MHWISLQAALLAAAYVVAGENFPFESVQLTQADVRRFSAIRFGDRDQAPPINSDRPLCRAWPGSHDWPSDAEWRQFNVSLGGALLRPMPAAVACYEGELHNETMCRWLVDESGRTHFWLDEPLSTLTQWPQGSTCMPVLGAEGTCTRGGFPEYVVNATTVKHIQAAVNFARNKNIRLVIKNTGHDFGGRSMGAGSLSIWVHNLKSFELIPSYTIGKYSGKAVRIAAGIESWELFNHMAESNISLVAPGGPTVGTVGGWFSVAGHGSLTSKYGLGADQALAINVVTADGRFRTVDPDNHEDLWWALRGGGPSTFGVITSVVAKAHPPLDITTVGLNFSVDPTPTNNSSPSPVTTYLPGNPSPTGGPDSITNTTAFWAGVSLSYRYCNHVIAAGGYCYSYVYPHGNNSFSFTSNQIISNISTPAIIDLLQPLYEALNALSIPARLPNASDISPQPYAGNGRRTGSTRVINTRYRSRLFPTYLWDNDTVWDEAFASIRAGVEEGGYTFHGIAYSPTAEIAGYPGADSAVNPAWRETSLHGCLMEVQPASISAVEARARDERVQAYVERWKELTPGAGAYMNEGDPAEKGWQQSFYGAHYRRLLGVKRKWDPWGLFWAQTTVGSEAWEVVSLDGYPAGQNGRLCRVRD